jgi:hypothetical protein
MSTAQDKIVAELKAAAEQRHEFPISVQSDERGVTVRKQHDGKPDLADVVEEYLWNSGQNMLIRVCYIVWEHIFGEDHQWGRFSTEEQALKRIAALFSPGSLGKGEYYITRLYTIQANDAAATK